MSAAGGTSGTTSQTPAPTPEAMDDPLSYIEQEDYAVMVKLGLRRHYWADTQDKGAHHDQRPCPSWCWIGQHEEYDHELDPGNPLKAKHSMSGTPHVALTLYPGDVSRGSSDRPTIVSAATLEPRLEQRGQEDPQIRVAFRRYNPEGKTVFSYNYLRLAVDDARDLITSLQYLVELAENG